MVKQKPKNNKKEGIFVFVINGGNTSICIYVHKFKLRLIFVFILRFSNVSIVMCS